LFGLLVNLTLFHYDVFYAREFSIIIVVLMLYQFVCAGSVAVMAALGMCEEIAQQLVQLYFWSGVCILFVMISHSYLLINRKKSKR